VIHAFEAGLVLCAFCAIVALATVLARLPALAAEISVPQTHANLDGLRAIAALAVMLAHGKGMYNLFAGNGFVLVEGLDGSLSHAAGLGVYLFFQITGFLFWDKVLRADGALPLRQHLSSRLRRLVPLYTVFAMAALGLALLRSGFHLTGDGAELARAVLGTISFGMLDVPWFNGDFLYKASIGITWTLAYEWAFYAALPLLALLHRRRAVGVVLVAYLAWQLASPTHWLVANFVAGMGVAVLLREGRLRQLQRHPVFRLAPALTCVVLAIAFWQWLEILEVTALAAILYLAVATPRLDRALRQPGLALTGRVSYSIYLLHSVLMYHLARVLHGLDVPGFQYVTNQWLAIAVVGMGVTVISAMTYWLVERPFMARTRLVPARAQGHAV